MSICREQARIVIAAALKEGRALRLQPLAVAVVDGGGHLVAFEREDGAAFLRSSIAIGKAAGAIAFGRSSRHLGELATHRYAFVASLTAAAPTGLVPAAGGIIAANTEGVALGAVGVSGDTSDNDELCALAGLAAVGLTSPG